MTKNNDIGAAFSTPPEPTGEVQAPANAPGGDLSNLFGVDVSNEPASNEPEPGQPINEGQGTVPPITENKNDQKRFEYWQSQASKLQNKLKELEPYAPVIETLKEKGTLPQPGEPQQQEKSDIPKEFPPPPERPNKPYNFSYAEAEDASSESAQYLRDVEEWQGNMQQWTVLKTQYDTAMMQENINRLSNQITGMTKAQEDAMRRNAQMRETVDYVEANYGMDDKTAQEFVQWGNNPANLSMDNLVKLFLMGKGAQVAQPNQVQTNQAQPSDAFVQKAQAAQSMQPMQGYNPAPGVTQNDEVVDSVLKFDKASHPFG